MPVDSIAPEKAERPAPERPFARNPTIAALAAASIALLCNFETSGAL